MQSTFSEHNGIRLETNTRKTAGKSPNIFRLNNTPLNNRWVKEEVSWEIKIYLELNENENTTYENLQDAVKAVLGGKFMALKAYI